VGVWGCGVLGGWWGGGVWGGWGGWGVVWAAWYTNLMYRYILTCSFDPHVTQPWP